MSTIETSNMSEMSSHKGYSAHPEAFFKARAMPGYNVMGWTYTTPSSPKHSTGTTVQTVQITSIPERITPSTHLTILRNPKSPDQHFGSMLSPALCNISDTYVRLLEKQYDNGTKLINDSYSRWMAKNKTDDEIWSQLRWTEEYLHELSPWTLKRAKQIARDTERDEMKVELALYKSFHDGELPPAPVYKEANPIERLRLKALLAIFQAYKGPNYFLSAGKQRREDMNLARDTDPEAHQVREEYYEEQERLEELSFEEQERLEELAQRKINQQREGKRDQEYEEMILRGERLVQKLEQVSKDALVQVKNDQLPLGEEVVIAPSYAPTPTFPPKSTLQFSLPTPDFFAEEEEESDTESESDSDSDNSPIAPFIYTNPLGLKSILKKTRTTTFCLDEKKSVSWDEYDEIFDIEAREIDQGPRVYSGADGAARMLADLGDDDEDSDEDSDEEDEEEEEEWGPGPNTAAPACVSTNTATTTNEETTATPSISTPIETEVASDDQTKADQQKTSLYLGAMTTPSDINAVMILLRLELEAEAALALLQSGFPKPLRARGTLRRCAWVPLPVVDSDSNANAGSRYSTLYEVERENEASAVIIAAAGIVGMEVPRIVLTTPSREEWELLERMEDLEERRGVEGWMGYLEERKKAQVVMKERLVRWRIRDGVGKYGGIGEAEVEGDSGYVSEVE